MRVLRALGAVLLIAAAGACAPDGDREGIKIQIDDADLEFERPAEAALHEGDRYAILTRDGKVRLALTDDEVYFRLSDELRAEIAEEIDADIEAKEGLARTIGGFFKRGVTGAMGVRVAFDVDDVRDIHYTGGELVFDFENEVDADLSEVAVDDEPVVRQFEREEARRFIREFRRVKAGR